MARFRRGRSRSRRSGNRIWQTTFTGFALDASSTAGEFDAAAVIADVASLGLAGGGDEPRGAVATLLRMRVYVYASLTSNGSTAPGVTISSVGYRSDSYIAKFEQDETFELPEDSSQEDTLWTGGASGSFQYDNGAAGFGGNATDPVGDFGIIHEIDVKAKRKMSVRDNVSFVMSAGIVGNTDWTEGLNLNFNVRARALFWVP